MEMVTAKPENANAWLIMSMPKIARIMDVSTYLKAVYYTVIVHNCDQQEKATSTLKYRVYHIELVQTKWL